MKFLGPWENLSENPLKSRDSMKKSDDYHDQRCLK